MELPAEVKTEMGYALFVAQNGDKAENSKPLKGFGSGVLEVVETSMATLTERFTRSG